MLKELTLICVHSFFLNDTAIDCSWGNWTAGTCSVTCGVGIRIDTREKLTMESNGGKCEGCETKIVECSKENCPGRHLKNHGHIEKSSL